MPKHGFVRHHEGFKIIQDSEMEAKFVLESNAQLYAMYPFLFQFIIHYQLIQNTLHITYKVENRDTKILWFSVGGHPAFNCPISDEETYTDYVLEFENPENSKSYLLDKDSGLLTQKTKKVFANDCTIELQPHLFDEDALIFKDLRSRKLSLTHRQKGRLLSVEFKDFNYLGIWAKPSAPYVCIEPWLGLADSQNTNQYLETKEGILALQPQAEFQARFSIEIDLKHL